MTTFARRVCEAWAITAVAFTVPSVAAEIVIREQYWQKLPKVYSVYLDHVGEPWFGVGVEGDVAATYAAGPHTVSGYDVMLLGDKAGRIWVQKRHRQGPARYYDGRAWHETTINPLHAVEDRSGRVFLIDESSAHVFDGQTWTRQPLVDEGAGVGSVQTVIDERGRVWIWSDPDWQARAEVAKHRGIHGAWCFDSGRWTRYSVADGFPAEQIWMLIPLSDDRFMVLKRPVAREQNYGFWSPAEPRDTRERPFLPPGDSVRQLKINSVDSAGRHLFLAEDAVRASTGRSGRDWLLMERNGTSRLLGEEEGRSVFRRHRGAYAGSPRMFGRIEDDPPPAPVRLDSALAEDRHGRRYFSLWPDDGVGVLWPKHERPGDVLRINPIEENDRRRQSTEVIRGSDGRIWDTANGIREWVDGAWQETTIKKLPHPNWYARPSAPWYGLGEDTVLVGGEGTLAVIQVRDVYQDAFAKRRAAKNPADDDGGIRMAFDPSIADAEAEGERTGIYHWLEGRLLDQGRWTDPRPIDEFLVRNRSTLARAFTERRGTPSAFSLQGDDDRLWAVYEGKVVHLAGDTKLELSLPDKPRRVSTCLLDRDRLLCAWLAEKTQRYVVVRLQAGALAVDDFAGPNSLPPHVGYASPSLWLTKHGSLFLWLHRDHRFHSDSDGDAWERRDGAWKFRDDLGAGLFEEPDGPFWCLAKKKPSLGEARQFRGYLVVQGSETHPFPLPEYCAAGLLTPGPNGKLNAAYGYWFLTLGSAENPLERPVRMRILSEPMSQVPAFVDSRGKILIGDSVEQ